MHPKTADDDVKDGDDENDAHADVVEDVGRPVVLVIVDVHCSQDKENNSHSNLKMKVTITRRKKTWKRMLRTMRVRRRV